IHPRHLAACWLYGLCRGIRSSRKLEEVEAAEQRECLDGSPTQLPPELANLDRRRQILRQALAQAQAADAAKKRKGINPEKNPAQAPITDPDSRVMPNKEGGYAPNYTPTAIT